ncbi:lysophospholipid acyltransferase family protein [Lichenihabitans psoromatis]|uniref:lysophospholipid acyltransferase family protein n=1 Tax=Lichenihabitans psoromatis TaxID=2528642 RepID=UPI001036E716|nr:lysophospholipid acyltransferase family protein [Lichenihabitans psoromatis]
MLKKLGRTRPVQETAGFLASVYLRLVKATNRFVQDPPDFLDAIGPDLPVIAAMWHGQHLMIHYAWPKGARVSALISRHRDGEINAVILRRFGVRAIRGSGGEASKSRRRGGGAALLSMTRALREGQTIVMTADVPKVARQAGLGIVALARLSGRPIYPIAVVTSRRYDFKSWDRASLGKPFGNGAMVLGDPIRVDRDADADALERARRAVEDGLDAVHTRAYALVGGRDPGQALADMRRAGTAQ